MENQEQKNEALIGGSELNAGLERTLCEVKRELCNLYLSQGRPAAEEALLCAAVSDCVTAIRERSNVEFSAGLGIER